MTTTTPCSSCGGGAEAVRAMPALSADNPILHVVFDAEGGYVAAYQVQYEGRRHATKNGWPAPRLMRAQELAQLLDELNAADAAES